MKPKIRAGTLRHWYFDEVHCRLKGHIYDDPRFYDGEPIRTSAIQKIKVQISGSTLTAETRDSIYELNLSDYAYGPADPAHQ